MNNELNSVVYSQLCQKSVGQSACCYISHALTAQARALEAIGYNAMLHRCPDYEGQYHAHVLTQIFEIEFWMQLPKKVFISLKLHGIVELKLRQKSHAQV